MLFNKALICQTVRHCKFTHDLPPKINNSFIIGYFPLIAYILSHHVIPLQKVRPLKNVILKTRNHLQPIILFCPFVFELITLKAMFRTYRYHCSKELLIAPRVCFCSKCFCSKRRMECLCHFHRLSFGILEQLARANRRPINH